MVREQITDKEAICLLSLFITGTTLILGIGGDAKNDAWIAAILGIIMAAPIIFVYSRIVSLFPENDLFEILEIVLGKFTGKIVSALYVWYAFHLGALVARNFGEFINTVAMPETPLLVPIFFLMITAIIIVRSGVEVMGRTSAYLLPLVLSIITLVQILVIPDLNFDYMKPVFGVGIGPILKGAFSVFSFPFAETVLFIGILFSLKEKKSPYKVYFLAVLISGLVIILLTLRNILVLGPMREILYFPSHVAVGRINVGDFIERIEVTVAFVFVVGAFFKSSICLFVASKGISCIFKLNDYRNIVIQVGLLMSYFAYIVYDSIMVMQYWAFKVYAYYAFPFQVIIPIMVWIFAEIKVRKRRTAQLKVSQIK